MTMRTPRDYQVAVDEAVERELQKVDSTLVVLPTGTGKTVIMSGVAKRRCANGAVLLLAHRVELLDQAAKRFQPDLGYVPQVIQGDRAVDWNAVHYGERVLIGSVQTLWREKRLKMLAQYPINTLLIDEAHHAVAKTYRVIWDYVKQQNPLCKLLGVTATPRRTDKKAMGIVFESLAYKMEIHEAIELGWLVEPGEDRVIIEGVDFSNVPLSVNEFGEADFTQSALEALMVEEGPLHAVAVPLVERAAGRRCLVFTAGVQHAHLLAAILNRDRPEPIAVAIDGKNYPPGDPRREQAVEDLRSGKIRYLVNFGIFTEGTDIPECDMVCVARPTKSLSVIIQILGRSLRPLPGVVDGLTTPEFRRQAIAASAKPNALVLYFIPKAANVKTVTMHDALGGNYEDDVKQLAKKISAEKPGGAGLDELNKAKALHGLLAEEELRKKIKAKVSYRVEKVSEYSAEGVEENVSDIRRGGASEKQIKLLVGLGVPYATAAGYSSGQAHIVLDKLTSERCTFKQRNLLIKYGENPDVNFAQARAIIDEIAANDWQPRKRESA